MDQEDIGMAGQVALTAARDGKGVLYLPVGRRSRGHRDMWRSCLYSAIKRQGWRGSIVLDKEAWTLTITRTEKLT
jgi:hypothetical protein